MQKLKRSLGGEKMKNFTFVLISALICSANVAHADNLSLDNYDSKALANCVDGKNLSAMMNISNPQLVAGSVIYMGKSPGGKQELQREVTNLPVISEDPTQAENTRCSVMMESTTEGNIDILGVLNAAASKDDVFKIEVRLISRQSVATVAENGSAVPAWRAEANAKRFAKILKTSSSLDEYWGINTISIYLVSVEQYKKVSRRASATYMFASGGVKYAKNESFKGSRIVVTGEWVPIKISQFEPDFRPNQSSVTIAATNNVPAPSTPLSSTTISAEVPGPTLAPVPTSVSAKPALVLASDRTPSGTLTAATTDQPTPPSPTLEAAILNQATVPPGSP